MYGGAPMPGYTPRTPWTPDDTAPAVGPYIPTMPNTTQLVVTPPAKRKLRVTTMHGSDGSIRIKVYVDDTLLSETISDSGSTLSVETEI